MVTKVALFGSTGHIAKGLISHFVNMKDYEITFFARSQDKLSKFFRDILYTPTADSMQPYTSFGKQNYDVVINCVGIGTPGKLKDQVFTIFELTEQFDNMVINYLKNNRDTLYINLSSGAAYCNPFCEPVNQSSSATIQPNHPNVESYYGFAKLYSEAKHRAMQQYNIVDLRVFSYFSRFIDLTSSFLITDIISCIKHRKTMHTNSINIVRDFVAPADLFLLVEKCIKKFTLNDAYDVYSLKSISKFEVLDYFSSQYGLNYEVRDVNIATITGLKEQYYSFYHKASEIGYVPKLTSLDCITTESKILMEG